MAKFIIKNRVPLNGKLFMSVKYFENNALTLVKLTVPLERRKLK